MMLSLVIRNLIFTILQPSIVAGLLPYYIIQSQTNKLVPEQLTTIHFLGVLIFALGFFIMLACIRSFAIKGKGTLSPIDPTKQLVISGMYRHSRNPMYVGVLLLLIGETIFYQSVKLCLYTLFIFIIFNLFILFIEEPRLKKDFGEAYQNYCDNVRRWF